MTPHVEEPSIQLCAGGRSLDIEPDRIYIIGSAERADLRLRHRSVAPHHASFSIHRGEMLVEDLGSPLGTWVDGERIETRIIQAGTAVSVGEVSFEVVAKAPAAAATVVPLVFASRPARGWHGHESFSEIMAAELKRTPWFTLSLLIHGLLLWLVYVLTPVPEREPDGFVAVQLDDGPDEVTQLGQSIQPEEEEVEVEEAIQSEPVVEDIAEEEIRSAFEADNRYDDAFNDFHTSFLGPDDSLFAKLPGGAKGGDILSAGGGKGLSKGFKSTVSGLRQSGLEIVFAFDSTGSMDPVLQATKTRLRRMLAVLHALVPDARVGIVTYRDHGRREDYVTRATPLARDYYRLLNFMNSVQARGGGDRPEAVFEALEVAVRQKWKRGSRRVVVLVGDAPAHQETQSKIDRLLRAFVRDGRSFVHAIMTSPDAFGTVAQDTRKSFDRITDAGKGQCHAFENEDAILRQVMDLAFGGEFRKSLEEVYRQVGKRQARISARYRDMVRRADLEAIERGLRKPVVADDLVAALTASSDRKIAEFLLDVLTRERFPTSGRQAAAYALQHVLDLPVPPLTDEGDGPIGKQLARDVHRVIRSKT